MKIKVSELSGIALDWAVGKCEGFYADIRLYRPSSNWSQGGPIIEREKYDFYWNESETNVSCTGYTKGEEVRMKGPAYLIAAMRCYVASKLGEAVEVPNDLLS